MDEQEIRTTLDDLREAMRRHADRYIERSMEQDINPGQLQEHYNQALSDAINTHAEEAGIPVQAHVTANPSGISMHALDPLSTFANSYNHAVQFYTRDQLDRTPWRLLNYEAIEDVVHKITQKRFPRIKKVATDEQIAKAMAKPAKRIAKSVFDQLQTISATVNQADQIFQKKQRILARAKRRLRLYVPVLERVAASQGMIEEEFAKMVAETRKLKDVAHMTIDGRGRVIVTTKLLYTKHTHWKRRKNIGVYQLRIDFTRQSPLYGVLVLNTTRRCGEYDSPTIHHTQMCTGNFGNDLRRDFYTQNLLELVRDTIDYIVSPNTGAGYMGYKGDKSRGWDAYLEGAKKMPKNYDFAKYDREFSDEIETGQAFHHAETVEDVSLLADRREEQQTRDLDYMRRERDSLAEQLSRVSFSIRTNYDNVLWNILRHMSLKDEWMQHYFRVIRERGYDRDAEIQNEVLDIQFRRTELPCIAVDISFRGRGNSRNGIVFIPLDDFVESIQRRVMMYNPGMAMWRIRRIGEMRLQFGWEVAHIAMVGAEMLDLETEQHIVDVDQIEHQISNSSWSLSTAGTSLSLGGLETYVTAAPIPTEDLLQAQLTATQMNARVESMNVAAQAEQTRTARRVEVANGTSLTQGQPMGGGVV